MTYTITDPCVDTKVKSCVEVCPVDCIHEDEAAGDRILYLDAEECLYFGACDPVWPVTDIFSDDDVPEAQQEYTPINALWFKDPEAARAKVNELNPPA